VALFVVVAASASPPARVIVTVMVFSLVWNIFITVLQMSNQGPVGLQFLGEFPIGPDQQGISVIQSGATRLMRPYSLLPHPNILGGLLAVYLLATVGWILSSERWKRWGGIILFAAGLWALLLTFSRSAWLGLVVGAFTMLPLLIKSWSQTQTIETRNIVVLHWRRFLGYFKRYRALILATLLSFLTVILFFFAYQPFLRARVGEGQESVELRSVSDRMVFLEFAHRSIMQRPLIGVGVGNFPWRIVPFIRAAGYDMRGDNAHHVLLSALADLGLVGFGLMVAALVFGTESVLTSTGSIQASNNDTTARIVLFGGFMALTFIGVLDHYPYTLLQFQTAWWGLLAVAMKSHGDGISTDGSA
jgi:O-antigen ligase